VKLGSIVSARPDVRHGASGPPARPIRPGHGSADPTVNGPVGMDGLVDECERFPFRFAPAYRWAALVFGVTPANATVAVTPSELRAAFGPWRVDTPLSNVDRVELTGPYHFVKTAGPARLSFADRGLTFATNGDRGVLITFHEPITGAEPSGRLRSPNLTVTVEDCPLLVASVISRTS
jgi:hypothetical protein